MVFVPEIKLIRIQANMYVLRRARYFAIVLFQFFLSRLSTPRMNVTSCES